MEVVAYLKNMKYVKYLDKRLEVKKVYPFINAVGAECKEGYFEKIKKLPYIEGLFFNARVTALEESRSEVEDLAGRAPRIYNGRGVGVCIMDTGISAHTDFLCPVSRVAAFKDIYGGSDTVYDDNGHGSFVAGIACGNGLASGRKIKGGAPAGKIIGVKVMGAQGECGVFDVLDGMQWVMNNRDKYNIRVVCMSFGSTPSESGEDPLERGAESLVRGGITVVCAAGNSGKGKLKSPATSPSVISVGAVNDEYEEASFSSSGQSHGTDKPEFYAKGVKVKSVMNDGRYGEMSGTSAAAPCVAGAAALVIQKYPYFLPWQVKQFLYKVAIKEGNKYIIDCDKLAKVL